jgi:hypothetical protein
MDVLMHGSLRRMRQVFAHVAVSAMLIMRGWVNGGVHAAFMGGAARGVYRSASCLVSFVIVRPSAPAP